MSTEKVLDNEIILHRLHLALTAAGVKKHGRGARIKERTAYSTGQISTLLNGKDDLNVRFVKSICREFSINEDYVWKGEGDILLGQPGIVAEPAQEYTDIKGPDGSMVLTLKGITPTQKLIIEQILKVPRERSADLIDYLRDLAEAGQRPT